MNKPIKINEIFHSVQGEGSQIGMPAIFLRLAGCNLWSGKEKDRDKSVCKFCDTDFSVKKTIQDLEFLMDILILYRRSVGPDRYKLLVITGGEPFLQLNEDDVQYILSRWKNFVAIETNGTLPVDYKLIREFGVHISLSPKKGSELKAKYCSDLKVVIPGTNDLSKSWDWYELHTLTKEIDAYNYFIMPQDTSFQNSKFSKEEYKTYFNKIWDNPIAMEKYKLGIQAHKYWGLQ